MVEVARKVAFDRRLWIDGGIHRYIVYEEGGEREGIDKNTRYDRIFPYRSLHSETPNVSFYSRVIELITLYAILGTQDEGILVPALSVITEVNLSFGVSLLTEAIASRVIGSM